MAYLIGAVRRSWGLAAAQAVDAIGTRDFVPRILDLLAAFVPSERSQAVGYSRTMRTPSLMFGRGIASSACRVYLDHFVEHDPFRACWDSGTARGIVTLDEAIGHHPQTGLFRARFLPLAGYVDELSVFLPRNDKDCLALFLERTDRCFTADDLGALEDGLALIQSLDRAHRDACEPPDAKSPDRRPDRATVRRMLEPDLTDRECDVILAMVDGLPPKRIAARLGITAGVVRNHRTAIYRKLGVTSERDLLARILPFWPARAP